MENYEYLIPTLTLPDANDRHVLAAAIHSNSSVIVTTNLKDFPKEAINSHGIEAQHPDEFITNLIDLSLEGVCAAVKRHRTSLRNPPKDVTEYLATLEKQALNETVIKFRELIDFI